MRYKPEAENRLLAGTKACIERQGKLPGSRGSQPGGIFNSAGNKENQQRQAAAGLNVAITFKNTSCWQVKARVAVRPD
jgi:hypothetical protein